MGTRFKITDIDNEYFYQIPKSLLTQKNYRGLNSDAKIIYSILKDRMSVSRKNNWKDDNGDIFLIYKQTDLAEILDLSVSSISRATKQLEEYGLIDVVRQGLNRPNKLYINKIELVKEEADIQDIELMFKDDNNVDTSKPYESRTCKNENPDLHICKSGLADMRIKTCKNGNQDLQIWESGFADMQTSNNYINQNKENNNNKESAVENFVNKDKRECFNLIKKLCDLGLDENQAFNLVNMYGEKVKYQLGVLKTKKNIKNRIGWLISSLRDNYAQNSLLPQIDINSTATIDNGRSRIIPLSAESAQYAEECAELACTIDKESPFYQAYQTYKKNKTIL